MTETIFFLDSKNKDVKGSSQNFTVYMKPPLILDASDTYEIALMNASIWYSWYNINSSNQIFRYYNGTEWKTITIPPGAYNITDINTYIQKIIARSDGERNKDSIAFIPNYNTIHSEVVLKNGYKIDFTVKNSLRAVLGFDSKIVDSTSDSDSLVDITHVNSVLVHCDLVSESYINGSLGDTIYSFSPDKPPGYLLSIQPNESKYLPITRVSRIDRINIRITDQDGEEIDLNNEQTSISLHFRKQK